MKVLYCALYYSYGEPEKGLSYEYYNLEAGLRDCVSQGLVEADYFYIDKERSALGVHGANNKFLQMVQQGGYDVIFHVAFNESIDLPTQPLKLAKMMGIKVVQWDCDASWRFHNFIFHRRDRYTHFVTTHSASLSWYRQFNMNVIRSQWGGSPLYTMHPDDLPEPKYDVVFVGQKHGVRPEFVRAMFDAGIDLHLWGSYWEGYPNWHQYGTFDDTLQALRQARICLNLSNPSQGGLPQIKGRHFEIPQTGGFQLSTPADDLHSYFEFDKEIVVADSPTDLIEEIKFYLDNPEKRLAIARAGHERMLQDHQWSHRFQWIFEALKTNG